MIYKSSSLAAALGVAKIVAIISMNLLTPKVRAQVFVQQISAKGITNFERMEY